MTKLHTSLVIKLVLKYVKTFFLFWCSFITSKLRKMENTAINPETLNDLIQINNDRVAGYEKAIEELQPEDSDLKALFVKMIGESQI